MVEVHHRALVVVNERTGTVVMGKDVRLGAVSILHGNFSIEVATDLAVSQPNPLSAGKTEVVPQQTVKAEEARSACRTHRRGKRRTTGERLAKNWRHLARRDCNITGH